MELIISCFPDKIVSSRTCDPKECRRGTLRDWRSDMKASGRPRTLEQPRLVHGRRVILSTSMVIHKHRKVPLSPASGERVRDDTQNQGAYEVFRKDLERVG
jgi:hypothetical protein